MQKSMMRSETGVATSDIELQDSDGVMRMRKSEDRDTADLTRTGKRPILKVNGISTTQPVV